MDQFFIWLSNNPFAANILVTLLGVLVASVVIMYLVAFFQGREISFWPPRFGKKPDKPNSKNRKGSDTQDTRPSNTDFELTGIWECNDEALYYIRQTGNKVFWLGEQRPERPRFCNVAFGSITGNEVTLQWADIPKGQNQYAGKIVLQIFNNGIRMKSISKEGGRFGGSIWERVSSK